MSINKLHKVTKITPLSNPEWQIRCRWGLLGFSRFFSNSKGVRIPERKQAVASPKKYNKKYGRTKNVQLATANINKNREKDLAS